MINLIWLALIGAAFLAAALTGRPDLVTKASASAAQDAVETALGLVGVMSLWLGMMRIAERAGLLDGLARLLRPVARRLFPDVPEGHPAMGAIVANMAANLLGMAGAATPFGLKAMQELRKLSTFGAEASPAMCTLVVLNTTAFTLVPATVIAFRSLAGSTSPAEIVLPTILVSAASSGSALLADAIMRHRSRL